MVIGVVAIEQSPAELQRNASADKAKSVVDDTTLQYARWAMFGTCAAAVIALIQAGLFVWQLVLMRRSTEDASEAAKAARDSASIASAMFTKSERPWIFLVAHRVERREGPPIQPQLTNNYWVSLVFRNDGRSPAFVNGIEFNFAPKDQLPEVPDYSLCSKLETPATLPVGDSFETRKWDRRATPKPN